jgi:hypothetical protein
MSALGARTLFLALNHKVRARRHAKAGTGAGSENAPSIPRLRLLPQKRRPSHIGAVRHHQFGPTIRGDAVPGQGRAAGQSTASTIRRVVVSAWTSMGRVVGRRPQMMSRR